jgi:hypothetical protein
MNSEFNFVFFCFKKNILFLQISKKKRSKRKENEQFKYREKKVSRLQFTLKIERKHN